MIKHRARKATSLPAAVCKTEVISVGTTENSNTVQYKSCTWRGIEENTRGKKVVGSVEKKPAGVNQNNWEMRIKLVAEEILSEKLKNVVYRHDDCKQLCTSLSKVIHDKLKSITEYGFRIIVLSFLGELQGEGIEAATQCTWEPQKDIMVTAYFKNETLFALTNIFLARISETIV